MFGAQPFPPDIAVQGGEGEVHHVAEGGEVGGAAIAPREGADCALVVNKVDDLTIAEDFRECKEGRNSCQSFPLRDEGVLVAAGDGGHSDTDLVRDCASFKEAPRGILKVYDAEAERAVACGVGPQQDGRACRSAEADLSWKERDVVSDELLHERSRVKHGFVERPGT